ncbi:hypothetical protein Ais01nite_76640 [Asanoa ishikariensis]|uniref:Uncharacterized protein n=1 Tax=Asanoa ishikariensis TaxID=137265 RepID=A0A1H3KX84_9ACTN|nr:hypothetical protein [Asanoa ishikariensis]GIF69629.1 hypothetical protein Ais01nite_76640 [Asanoa ishikariensis]SDY56857.1 hypothetical protein SAMN05421684_0407 [Asanoa ishikariensis]
MATVALTSQSLGIAGVLLITIVTIETGGYYLTKVARGAVELTDFQKAFARAGHAHAGVFVILSLVALPYADAAGAHGFWGWLARTAIPIAAILMPAGFFFSSMGSGRTKPNALIALLWIGALFLAAGVLTLGILVLAAA